MVSGLVYVLARIVIAVFRAIPRSLAIAILKLLAACVYYLDSRHRHIADVNLKIAFPDYSPEQRSWTARRSFQNTAMNLLEISKLPELTPENISDIVEYDADNGLNNYSVIYKPISFSDLEVLAVNN